jgi:hypothetical protein
VPRQPAQRRPQADDAVARLPHRDAREQVEVDREPLAVAGPRLGAEDGLHGQRVDAVDDCGRAQVGRRVAPAGDELDPGEAEQRERGGVAAPALRVGPDARQPDSAPGAERAEQVAEQNAREGQADPEVDQDEGRGEVVERRPAALVAGEHDEHQQRDADRRAEQLQRPAAERAPEPAGQRSPGRILQSRARPQQRQSRERGHHHDRRSPCEDDLRNRQRGALDDPVRLGAVRQQRDRRGRAPGHDRQPRPARHNAVLSACSIASRPNEPSSRAVMRPSLPTANSHGSVGRLNARNGARSPFFGSLSV